MYGADVVLVTLDGGAMDMHSHSVLHRLLIYSGTTAKNDDDDDDPICNRTTFQFVQPRDEEEEEEAGKNGKSSNCNRMTRTRLLGLIS